MLLACWATALAIGIIIGIAAGTVAAIPIGAGILGVGILIRGIGAGRTAWILAAFVLGLWLGRREVALATASPTISEDVPIEIDGEIVRGADASKDADTDTQVGPWQVAGLPPPPRRCHLRLALAHAGGRPARGTVLLSVSQGVPDLAPGDWVRLSTRLYLPRGFANPGLPDARLLARAQGIDWLASVRLACDLHRIPGRVSLLGYVRRAAFRLRQAMADAINQRLPGLVASFVRTLVLGERSDVPRTVEEGFRAAGATHVLSVSGLHLAVVVALFYQLLRRLIARVPALALRVSSAALASALSLPACTFYAMLTGEAVATMRSAIMAQVVLMASILNRPLSLASGIAIAAIALLVSSPLGILAVSFQLSFVSVIALGLFARWLPVARADKQQRELLGRGRDWVMSTMSASLAASLCSAPLVAHHFGEITPAAPLGNLALVPIVELVVLPCGLVGALLAIVHPWLGAIPLWIAGTASQAALVLADLFRRFAPVLLVEFPNWLEVVGLTGSAGFLLHAITRGPHARRPWLVLAACATLIAGGSLSIREVAQRSRADVEVTFIDVGQGDAALVEGPGGFAALIDGGGRYDNSFETGARIVEPFLRARGITRLDAVILSHPHPDHMNGLFRVLERFPVRTLWTNGDDGGNPLYREFIRLAGARGIATPVPTLMERGGMTIEALSPRSDGRIGVPSGLSANDASLVVRLNFGGRRILFAGDIGSEGEAELFDLGSSRDTLASDVLKMPHHGSRYASSAGFLDAISPTLAVASAGKFNRFGLPSPVALARYARRGIRVVRTDEAGAVSVVIGARGAIRLSCTRYACR